MHRHPVEAVRRLHDDAVVRRDALNAGEHVLHLAREHVRAADDEHIVAAGAHLLHARARAAAGARLAYHAGQVVRAVAQHGDGLLVERREHELAHLALAHRLAGLGVDDLPQEMVLGDMLHVAAGQALARHARAHDLGQAVVVGTHDVHALLDLGLEARRARLAPEQAHAQRGRLPVESEPLPHLAHVQGVGGRGDEHRGAVVPYHGDVALGVARAGGDHHAAELLAAVVQAETSGEHAVAERHLHAVAGHDARHLRQARDAVAPHVHVVRVVAHDDGLAGRAGRRVQLHYLVERDGEQTVGKRVAQHGLVRERQLAHVVERADVPRRDAEGVHALAVPRHAVVGPSHLGLQLLQLERADLLARRALPGAVVDGQAGEVAGAGRRKSGSFRGQVATALTAPRSHAVAPGPSEPSARARSS